MSFEDFNNFVLRLYEEDKLSNEEIRDIDNKAAELIGQMREGDLDYDTQNAIDLYINYYDDSRYLDSEKSKNIMAYYEIIEERNNKKLQMNNQKSLKFKPINSDGIISAIAVLEMVLIGGIIVAFLVLALTR